MKSHLQSPYVVPGTEEVFSNNHFYYQAILTRDFSKPGHLPRFRTVRHTLDQPRECINLTLSSKPRALWEVSSQWPSDVFVLWVIIEPAVYLATKKRHVGRLGNKQVDAGNVISWTAARLWNITWFNWMTFSLVPSTAFAFNVCFSQCWLTDCIWLLEKFPCPVQRQMNISAHYKNVYFVSINIVLLLHLFHANGS